jgi:hypothetical protein
VHQRYLLYRESITIELSDHDRRIRDNHSHGHAGTGDLPTGWLRFGISRISATLFYVWLSSVAEHLPA